MIRTVHSSSLLALAATFALAALPATGNAQNTVGPMQVPLLTATPFSAVGITETLRLSPDGNRFSRTNTFLYYRDTQGRTRVERKIALPRLTTNEKQPALDLVEIRDPVNGELTILSPLVKTAETIGNKRLRSQDQVVAPAIFMVFQGVRIGPRDPGWAAPVSLGVKSVDGLEAIGTRQVYTAAAGSRFGNEKPVVITVEQWFSPALGMILSKTGHASSGGESNYHLEQIVQAEPDASLFAVPADYRKYVVSVPAKTAANGMSAR